MFLEKRVSVSTYFDVLSNLILHRLQKYGIAKSGETRGSRTTLVMLGNKDNLSKISELLLYFNMANSFQIKMFISLLTTLLTLFHELLTEL